MNGKLLVWNGLHLYYAVRLTFTTQLAL